MNLPILTEVKAILKSLVLSCPDKMTIEQLNQDYRKVEGQSIPFHQLGYKNVEQFLRSIPDTLKVFGSGQTATVCFVANEKSDHIHDMIMKQKKTKTLSRSKSLGRNTNNAVQKNNRYQKNARQTILSNGQQLSPYQTVNRSNLTRTPQVWNIQSAMCQTSLLGNPPSSVLLNTQQLYNCAYLNTQQLYNYAFTPVLSSLQNGIIKPVKNQPKGYENEVSQVNSMLKNCTISNIPPQNPRYQNRSVNFTNNTKPSAKVQGNSTNELVKEDSAESNKPENSTKTKEISFREIKVPRPKKHIPTELSNEIIIDKHSKAIKSQEVPSTNLDAEKLHKEDTSQNKKSSNEMEIIQSTFFADSIEKIEDNDEAIPKFAAKSNVFRYDFPDDTVPYGTKIPPYSISDTVTVGCYLKVFVTEIHNPFKFWFHIYNENNELDTLMYQIERYYSSLDPEDLRIPIMCMAPGQVCAACYNGFWHRAQIVAPPLSASIKVSFVDYGTVTEVEIKNIKFLLSCFAELPVQAIRGCLSSIKPCELHWSHDATRYFLTLVMELMLYAKITEIDREKQILYMVLCDTNGSEVVQVNGALVSRGYAIYNDEWKTEKIKQNNGKRIHHPCEDFPTFSMIEADKYPSFQELVSLRERGIDYEAIYDPVIYNQSSILNRHESASDRLRNLPYFLMTSNPFRSDILLQLYAKTSKAV